MAKAFNKKESKRITCHKKYKIRRKVREHNKKLAKTLKNSVNKRKKIDGNIPNMAPFKEEILLEAIQQAETTKEEKKLKKKTAMVVTKHAVVPKLISSTKSTSCHVVISNADLLLWVLDSRNVAECLSEVVMDQVKGAEKKFIFVLNKIDLVPAKFLKIWYAKLSKIAPTFPVKSTEIMRTECELIIPAFKQKFARFGGFKCLLSHLNQESEAVKVGVIGGASVGKSCVVSSILKFCGRTKAKRSNEAKISDKVKLLTTPGLISAPANSTSEMVGPLHVLSNMSKYMNYPVEVAEALARVVTRDHAMVHFTLPLYEHPSQFLDTLAIRYNTLLRGKPDHEAAARTILKLLRDGKLRFHVATTGEAGEFPDEIEKGVKQFLYSGSSLPLLSSELSMKIVKAVKKKRDESDMEGVESGNDEDDGDEASFEDEDSDGAEYSDCDME